MTRVAGLPLGADEPRAAATIAEVAPYAIAVPPSCDAIVLEGLLVDVDP
jgi:hypothetical protein